MSVQSVSPFSNFKTNFNTVNSAVANPQEVQKAGKINKKTAAIVGGLAALAFAGTVAVVAIKRHKVPDEIKTALDNFKATNEAANSLAESAQKQAEEIVESGKKLFDEVTELFKKGDEIAPDGTVLRKITGDDAEKIMEEFSQDGKLFRKSTFVNDILNNVQEGIEELADGSRKVAKGIDFFEDGTPSWYQEGIEELADRSRKVAKGIDFFEDGTPSWYQEGIEELADGSRKIAKEIIFSESGPMLYQEGIEQIADGSCKTAKGIIFSESGPMLYQEGIEQIADGSCKTAKIFELTDKGWQKVSE